MTALRTAAAPTADDGTTAELPLEVDVAVVGCGPVGALAAVLLARAGHRVAVLDRHHRPYPLPRAVVFDDEIARVFAAAGLAEIMDVSEPAGRYEWHNAAGETLLRFDDAALGRSGWPRGSMFAQPEIEAVLHTRLTALPGVTMLRGHEVVGVQQNDDGALVDSLTDAGGRHRCRASYVIGADGANSFVRGVMDTGLEDLGFAYDWLVVDLRLSDGRTFTPNNLQVCDPRRPTTAVSGGPGRRRWEFMRLPHESIADLNELATAWRLLAPWDVRPDNAVIERHAVYTFQARWANRWRDGRLFLAGDAAHLMPPFAGQGMCSGLRDAANLAWKLNLVLRGVARGALLDTYEQERSVHVQHAIRMSLALGEVICATDPQIVAARDAAMTAGGGDPAKVLPPIPLPRLGAGVQQRAGVADDWPIGVVVPQGRVAVDGQVTLFDQAVGNGFVVLVDGDAAVDPVELLSDDQLAALRRLGAHVVHITGARTPKHAARAGTQTVRDLDDVYRPFLVSLGASALVVRPDFYLFGAARSAAELSELTNDLLDQLDATRDVTEPLAARGHSE